MKNKFFLSVLCLIILFFSVISTNIINAQPSTIVKGFVYKNDEIVKPDEVQILFESQSRKATVYQNKSYLIIFTDEEVGSIGSFIVVYQGNSYIPPEILTIQEEYVYNLDLHIGSSGGASDFDQPTNIKPVADAGGPYYEVNDVPVYFNGSESYDEDGAITKYEWDFGDGSTSTLVMPNHTYLKDGNYSVKLSVTDNEGETDTDITFVLITEKPNYPPNKPELFGLATGKINIEYKISIKATDPDNDTIKYNINWSDDTNITTTEFVQNATEVNVTHNWTKAGIYTIKVNAVDDKDAISQYSEMIVLVDAIYCQGLGYLTDYSSDGIYDLFYHNGTGVETQVELTDGLYLIDIDNDKEYDYQFDITNNKLNAYVNSEAKETNLLDMIKPYLPYIVIFLIIILLILVALILTSNKQQIQKKQKIFYTKKKDEIIEKEITTEKIETSIKHEKIKSIEEEVDELLLKIK